MNFLEKLKIQTDMYSLSFNMNNPVLKKEGIKIDYERPIIL